MKDHMRAVHEISPVVTDFPKDTTSTSKTPVKTHDTFACELCTFTGRYNRSMKTHMETSHPDVNSQCELCAFQSNRDEALLDHIMASHMKTSPRVSLPRLQEFRCKNCNFTATNQSTLRAHVTKSHPHSLNQKITFECEVCPFTTSHHIHLRKHIAVTHARFACDLCSFTSSSDLWLSLHKEHNHVKPQPQPEVLSPCVLCGISFVHQDDLDNHIQRRHTHKPDETPAPNTPPNHALAMVLEEQIDMAQTLREFKDSVNAQLSEIRNDQHFIRENMQQMVQDNNHLRSSFTSFGEVQSKIDNQLQNISASISSVSRPPVPIVPTISSTSQTSSAVLPPHSSNRSSAIGSPSSRYPGTSTVFGIPQPVSCTQQSSSLEAPASLPCPDRPPVGSSAARAPAPAAFTARSSPRHSSTTHAMPSSLPSERMPTSQRSKVLFIADTIGSHADIRHLEEATNTLVYRESAYQAQFNADAFQPHQNFMDVSFHTAPERNYTYAVLQGSSSDISALDTSPDAATNLEYLKQQVFIASQNMISAARNILLRNSGIERVFILDRIPRFDTEIDDPAQLKSFLSEYGNQIFRDELEKCDLRNKISVCSHILPKELNQKIYGHPARKGYDGIHLYGNDGSNFYTRSVCNILQSNMRKHSREAHNHVIPRATSSQSSSASRRPRSSSPKQSSSMPHKSAPAHPTWSFQKPESVIIEIEPPAQPDQLFYSVPVSNQFTVLGN